MFNKVHKVKRNYTAKWMPFWTVRFNIFYRPKTFSALPRTCIMFSARMLQITLKQAKTNKWSYYWTRQRKYEIEIEVLGLSTLKYLRIFSMTLLTKLIKTHMERRKYFSGYITGHCETMWGRNLAVDKNIRRKKKKFSTNREKKSRITITEELIKA